MPVPRGPHRRPLSRLRRVYITNGTSLRTAGVAFGYQGYVPDNHVHAPDTLQAIGGLQSTPITWPDDHRLGELVSGLGLRMSCPYWSR